MTTADAAKSSSKTHRGAATGSPLDDGLSEHPDWAWDDRPLVRDLSTAEVVQEALAALRRDRVAPPEEPLVPGMSRPLPRQRAGGPKHAGRGVVEAVNPHPDHSANRSSLAGTVGRHRRRLHRLRGRRSWLVQAVSVLLAVGIALGAITVANRLGYDGEQPGVQSEVIPEADVSQSLPPSTQPLQETNPNEPATAGSAPASSAQTAGALTTSTGATAPAIAPATGGQQPAVVSSLDDDDVGFGWPTSAFGTAGG